MTLNIDPEFLRKNAPEFLRAAQIELAKRSLKEFTRQAWPILEPGTPFKDGWVIDAICEHLEAVLDGHIKRLVITVPPGSMKSRLARVNLPLYAWTRKPWLRFIGASYALSLAERDNYYARTVLMSDWYQKSFGVSISAEQGAKVNFDNSAMGGMRAISVGGATTGFRGDLNICFPAGEMVETERGPMAIERVVALADPSLRVWTLDPKQGRLVLAAPTRWLTNPGDDVYEIGFSDGTVLRCTGDHLLLTSGGWKAAAALLPTDALPRLDVTGEPIAVSPVTPRFPSAYSPDMHRRNPVTFRDRPSGLVGYLRDFARNLAGYLRRPSGFEGAVPLGVGHVFASRAVGEVVDVVVERVAVQMADIVSARALAEEGVGDRLMRLHDDCSAAYSQVATQVSRRAKAQLEDLRRLAEAARALAKEHGFWLRSDQPSAGDRVPLLGSGYKSPLYVRRVGHADTTFCLTVASTGNFVCSNTIVSNCDDGHNASEGESDAKRSEAVQWFLETFQTRVNDLENSPIIVIGQRIHEEDIPGAAIELGYEHLNIPMHYDPDRARTTSIGWSDPRATPGELMWPERFPETAVRRLEHALGPYAAAAQLEQHPVPRKGGLINADALRFADALPDEPFIWVRAWDMAASEGAGAYTVGTLMGYAQNSKSFWIADVKRKQLGPGGVRDLIKSTAAEDGIATKIILPQDPGQAGKALVNDLIAMLVGYNAVAEVQSGSKETRAAPFSAQVEIGAVHVLQRTWTRDFVAELRFFPKGKFKDQVDATASAFNALAALTRQKKRTLRLAAAGEGQNNWAKVG